MTLDSVTLLQHTHWNDAALHRVRAFLDHWPGPRMAHDPAWVDILRKGLDQDPIYLEAVQGERTVGVLPLAVVESYLFGRFLVSLPYLNQGGPLANDSTIAKQLVAAAIEIANKRDVRYLELRNLEEIDHLDLNEKKTSKVLMWLDLPSTSDGLWKSFKPEVRNQIRKGEKAGLTVTFGAEELLGEFYEVFSVNMRDLGTPVFGRKLFQSILTHLPGRSEIGVVRLEHKPIAAGLLLHDAKHTEVPSASSLREYNKTCANMLLYHHLLLRAIERGQRVFDFGRSSEDSGTFKFKKQWGAVPRPSVWQYHVRKGSISDVRPDNPKYRRRIETWKKLPLWLTKWIGPAIVRGIP